jgi:hypothetical protein
MLLASTSDKIRLTTGSAGNIVVTAEWTDLNGTTITPGRTNTAAITTATTTDIVASPASSTSRRIKHIAMYNAHATDPNTVTVIHTDGTNANNVYKVTLTAGAAVEFVDGQGWVVPASGTALIAVNNLSDLTSATTARTNLGLAIGSNVQAYDAQLTDLAGLSYTGNSLKAVRVNAGETAFELATIAATPGGSTTQVQYNSSGAFAGDSGFVYDSTNKCITLGGATVTADKPLLDLTQTWNNGAVSFYGIKMNITQTAYGGGALMELRVGGVAKFKVRYDGNLDVPTVNVGTPGGNIFCAIWNNSVDMVSGGKIGFNSSASQIYSGSMDTNIMRVAAGILGVRNGSTGGAAISMVEQTAPSAPSTNGVYIYAEDNGSGKTRLMALFATGAAQQIAIEP